MSAQTGLSEHRPGETRMRCRFESPFLFYSTPTPGHCLQCLIKDKELSSLKSFLILFSLHVNFSFDFTTVCRVKQDPTVKMVTRVGNHSVIGFLLLGEASALHLTVTLHGVCVVGSRFILLCFAEICCHLISNSIRTEAEALHHYVSFTPSPDSLQCLTLQLIATRF